MKKKKILVVVEVVIVDNNVTTSVENNKSSTKEAEASCFVFVWHIAVVRHSALRCVPRSIIMQALLHQFLLFLVSAEA